MLIDEKGVENAIAQLKIKEGNRKSKIIAKKREQRKNFLFF